MKSAIAGALALAYCLLALPAPAAWHQVGQRTIAGLEHPESVALDSRRQVLYLSCFGPKLKPLLRDGQGYISKLSLEGQVLQERFLPGPGQRLHKPKGLWVKDDRLWVTDIDAVWVFDLNSRRGRRLALPGARFANDLIVEDGKLYASDTGSGTIYLVTPADFLDTRARVSTMLVQPGLGPNGLALNQRGGLLVATFADGGAGRIYRLTPRTRTRAPSATARLTPLTKALGRLDGLALLPDGTILYTDWDSGGLHALDKNRTPRELAGGFQGPADFALVPREGGKRFQAVVPDLVRGRLRFVTLEP